MITSFYTLRYIKNWVHVFFSFLLWETENCDKSTVEVFNVQSFMDPMLDLINWATLLSSYQFTNGWPVHDARSFDRIAFQQRVNIWQFRYLQPTNQKLTTISVVYILLRNFNRKIAWSMRTCANRSIVRRRRRARSPSSMAQSIIISLHVRPEAQASTMPANWLSKQQGIYKPTILLQD